MVGTHYSYTELRWEGGGSPLEKDIRRGGDKLYWIIRKTLWQKKLRRI